MGWVTGGLRVAHLPRMALHQRQGILPLIADHTRPTLPCPTPPPAG